MTIFRATARSLVSPSILFALLLAAVPLFAQAQPSQEAPSPVIAQVDYMQVAPDRADEYLSVERELWKPLHQARADNGRILGWQLYVVRYPAGTGHDYQYITVTLYDNLGAVEDPEYMTYAQQVHPDVDVALAVERTNDTRALMRSELWFQHDLVAADTPPSEPPPFLQVDFMKVPTNGSSDYVTMEQDIFKPVHQARAEAGTIASWGLWEMALPAGTSQRHNYGTATAFQSLSAMQESYPDGVWEEVHPDENVEDLMQQVNDTRDLVQLEVWELVEAVSPSTSTASGGR